MRKLFYAIIIVLLSAACDQQKKNKNLSPFIIWSEKLTLTHEDFNGSPPKNAEKVENLVGSIYYNHNCSVTEPTFKLVTLMSRNKSWRLPRERWKYPERFNSSLRWNVFYFDLLEIEVRKLRKQLVDGSITITNMDELSELTRQCHNKQEQRWDSLIAASSRLVLNDRKYKEVKKKIHSELNSLKEYDISCNTLNDTKFNQ